MWELWADKLNSQGITGCSTRKVQLIAFCFCFLECVKFYLYAQVLHKFISQKTLSWVKDAATTTTTATTTPATTTTKGNKNIINYHIKYTASIISAQHFRVSSVSTLDIKQAYYTYLFCVSFSFSFHLLVSVYISFGSAFALSFSLICRNFIWFMQFNS